MLRPYIIQMSRSFRCRAVSTQPSSPFAIPPDRIIPNIPSHTIEIGTTANDLIEIIPLPDPTRASAALGIDPRRNR
jgi:hypothetical protein